MGSEADHLAIANRFQLALDHNLENLPDCAEWVATIAFYKALHVVEAVFSTDSSIVGTPNHTKRLDILKRHSRFKMLFSPFSTLHSVSSSARYAHEFDDKAKFSRFSEVFPERDIQTVLLDRFLHKLEFDAKKFLSNPDSLEIYQATKAEKAA